MMQFCLFVVASISIAVAIPGTDVPGYMRGQERNVCRGATLNVQDVQNVRECANFCDKEPLCTGVNIQMQGTACVLKKGDCERLEGGVPWIYYKRRNPGENANGRLFTRNVGTNELGRGGSLGDNLSGGYEMGERNVVCRGEIIEEYYTENIGKCYATCDSRQDCTGFNIHVDGSRCVFKGGSCDRMERGFPWIYYQKRSASDSQMRNARNDIVMSKTQSELDNERAAQRATTFYYRSTPGHMCRAETLQIVNEPDCKIACDGNPDCVGMNKELGGDRCVLKMGSCINAPNDKWVFFQKFANV